MTQVPNSTENLPEAMLSVIVPLFNEEDNIDALLESLVPVMSQMGEPFEVLLVDDGSKDGTWQAIQKRSALDPRIKGLTLSRNFGHQNALFAGMHFAMGNAIITMDGDLQHPPEKISEFVSAWRRGFKIVDSIRIDSRETTLFKQITSRWFYKIFSWLSGMPMSKGSSDFRLVDRQVAEAMKEMRDIDLFLRGMVHWLGYSRTTIQYQAAERYSGRTKFSLFRMARFAVSSVLSFSLVPLRLGIWVGLVTGVLSFIELAYIAVRYFQGGTVEGWASTLTVMSFMFGVLFVLIGLIGTYLGSIFETLKNRPRFLVSETTEGANRR